MRRLIAIFFLGITFISLRSVAQASIYSVGLDKHYYTSDFMMGSAAVAIIFPESDGSLDGNTESWSESRKTQVVSEIMSGLDWWTQQNPNSPMSFTYVTYTVPTRYEPITRPYSHESYWIPDVLGQLGYPGSRFTASRNFVNDLRNQQNTDWGFIIFVVDSLNDTNGKFTDSYFAYAYLGGPFMVMTYDNGGYGINNMDVVAAHETGHIFHALDEYAGGSSPYAYSYGYFSTVNGNHVWSPTANDSTSIMRGGLRWGLSSWARQMVGWRDNDGNNRDDILDLNPTVNVVQQQATTNGNVGISGQAQVNVLPRQGSSSGFGLTLDTIAGVEYRIGAASWKKAVPVDGAFDSAIEPFNFEVAPSIQGQSLPFDTSGIELRAITAYSVSVDDGGNSLKPLASSLDSAHPFPNPFKPNSQLNHTEIQFTGLTGSAKLQIFTVAGEPVYHASTDSVGSSIPWLGIDQDGKKVSSGVYYYLITDPSGGKKEGKIAIIR